MEYIKKKNKRLKSYNITQTIEKLQKLDNITELSSTIKQSSTNTRKSIKNMLIDEGIDIQAKQVTHNIMMNGSEKNQLEAVKIVLKLTGDLKNDNTTELNANGNINVNIIDRFELNPKDN